MELIVKHVFGMKRTWPGQIVYLFLMQILIVPGEEKTSKSRQTVEESKWQKTFRIQETMAYFQPLAVE